MAGCNWVKYRPNPQSTREEK